MKLRQTGGATLGIILVIVIMIIIIIIVIIIQHQRHPPYSYTAARQGFHDAAKDSQGSHGFQIAYVALIMACTRASCHHVPRRV